MIYRKDAIVLRSIDYRNTSKIIHLLLDDSSRISLVAKAGRRTNSKFAGNIEPVSLVQVVYYIKSDKDIGILKEASLKEYFSEIKRDLYRLDIAWSFIWMASKIPDPQTGLFGLSKRVLGFLNRGFKEEVLVYYMLSIFKLSGVTPTFDRCVNCGKKEAKFFNISKGGVLCRECGMGDELDITNIVNALCELGKGRMRIWKELTQTEKKKILGLIYDYSQYHLGDWVKRLREILPFDIIPNER